MTTTHAEHKMELVTTADLRDLRYGEIFIITPEGVIDYTSAGVGDCPADKWDALDVEQIKQEWGAVAVQKNGPKFLAMDTSALFLGERASFGGIEMRYVSTIPLSALAKAESGAEPYKVTTTAKTHRQGFEKGKPVFELVDAEGHAYVMMSHVEQFPIESLPTLGEKMKLLPEGWQYRSRILTEDLVLDLKSEQTVTLVSDEFGQYYNGIPETM